MADDAPDKYSQYATFVNTICDLDDARQDLKDTNKWLELAKQYGATSEEDAQRILHPLDFFKSHPDYQYMLEHVSQEQGQQYLCCIISETDLSMKTIRAFCDKNDSIGHPTRYNFGGLTCSPTSLRYIYQAHLILTHFKQFEEPSYKLLEVGCGYGGLCLAILFLAPMYNVPIESYTLVDLAAPSRLQKKYLKKCGVYTPLHFYTADTFGADIVGQNFYFISNYCFSEISLEFQTQYITHLFPKVSHGFIAWNEIPLYDFGFPYREEPEIPNTGGDLNRFVYF